MIVLCAGMRWDDVKLADRHMAEHLLAHGPVLYVDPPVSHLTQLNRPDVAASIRGPRLRVLGPGLARLSPVVPPKPTHPAVVEIATRIARRQLRDAVRALGGSVRAVVSTWLFIDAYGVCGERRRVYWWTDDPVGAAALWGHTEERMAAADERLARASDLIVAVNEGATERLRARGLPAEYLPNGCDAAMFAGVDDVDAASDVALDGPVAAFVGHLNGRTDLALLEGVADAGLGLLLIGPKDPAFEPDRFARLIARANVSYLGPRGFEELPAYLKVTDVGLVPYGNTEFNRWSFPMKTLEYLAAGRPVVATSLPATRSLDTELVTLADTPDEFAASVTRQAPLAREPRLVAARRAFAAGHSWADRAERLVRLLERPS
ncbi:MAG TPA: glycosyltransferase [Solirubrobacteraceae bacterium]|nr:glycosyltransferase [Solirubrobacteraceae bacterium]